MVLGIPFKYWRLAVGFCLLGAQAHADPSFDRAKAIVPIEKIICGNDDLANLDASLGKVYQDKKTGLNADQAKMLSQDQREWLIARVTECRVPAENLGTRNAVDPTLLSCLNALYRKRIVQLSSSTMDEDKARSADQLLADGEHEFDALRYLKAKEIWEKAAVLGDTKAMVALGDLYDQGVGVPVNHDEAMHLWREASSKGDGDAMMKIGYAYLLGRGVARDLQEATKWWLDAGDHGNARGMSVRAREYRRHNDFSDALAWLRKASDAGDEDAMFSLCEEYRSGKETQRDPQQAETWCNKGLETLKERAAHGDVTASRQLGLVLMFGYHGTKTDVAEAVARLRDAAKRGDVEAADRLADVQETRGTESKSGKRQQAKSLGEQGRRFLFKDAQAGSVPAMIALGKRMTAEFGRDVDCKKGIDWLLSAANRGSEDAMTMLGDDYHRAVCVDIDDDKARIWLEKAAALGDQTAQQLLKWLPRSR